MIQRVIRPTITASLYTALASSILLTLHEFIYLVNNYAINIIFFRKFSTKFKMFFIWKQFIFIQCSY